MQKVIAYLFAAALVLGPLSAAYAAGGASHDYPQALRQMIQRGGLKVVRQFQTDKSGLTGYVVQHRGYTTVLYSENGYIFLGPLFGPKGQNLSRRYKARYAPTPDISQAINGLDDTHIVSQGPAHAPTIYVFADPNCIYCHRVFERVQPAVAAGHLRVKWILVGLIQSSSPPRAAAILTANNPLAAWKRNERHFSKHPEHGGIQPASHVPSAIADVLKHNGRVMRRIGGTGTPTIVFRDNSGDWHAKVGVPPEGWLKHYKG